MAATLWGGDGSCASHASAAALWGFPSFDRGSAPVEIVTPRTRGPKGVRLHRPNSDRWPLATRVDGVPATPPGRTLVDLARKAPAPVLEAALHHCIRTRLTTVSEMRELVRNHRGRGAFGAPKLERAVSLYDGDPSAPESPLESRLLRLLVAAPIPPPLRQHEVLLPGRVRRRLDFAWPKARVGLEADSYQWHSSPAAWRADRRRRRELEAAGWVILSATAADLKDPKPLLASLARALADGGRPPVHGRR